MLVKGRSVRMGALSREPVRSVLINGGSGEAGVASVAVSLQVAKMDGARLVHGVGQSENAGLGIWIPNWSKLTVAAVMMETLIVRQVAATFA